MAEAGERLLGPLTEAARALEVGDRLDPELGVGPVISVAARARIEAAIAAAAAAGATIAVDGRGAPRARKGIDAPKLAWRRTSRGGRG